MTAQESAVVRGTINLLGANSSLFIQSDKFTYWEGEATVPGNITLLGGVSALGADLHGANAQGTSLYIHAASQLYASAASSTITLRGGQDIEIGQHEARLVEGPDQVLAARRVDGRQGHEGHHSRRFRLP